jgi:hypothetical protein
MILNGRARLDGIANEYDIRYAISYRPCTAVNFEAKAFARLGLIYFQ